MKLSVVTRTILSDCVLLHSIHVDAFYIHIKGRILAGISYFYVLGQEYFHFSLCIDAHAHIPCIWWGSFLYCTIRMFDVYLFIFHSVFKAEDRAFLTREG